MSGRIYLDYAAAAPLDGRVADRMAPFGELAFGNPNAIHEEGRIARKAVDEARAIIANILHARPQEIVFTGSGTESANLAISGVVSSEQCAVCRNSKDRNSVLPVHCSLRTDHSLPHVITSVVEHHAVLEPIRDLEARGLITVTYLPVDAGGRVDPRAVFAALCPETVLVSIMYANNEIGTIQPIAAIAKAIRKWKKEHGGATRETREGMRPSYPYFHTDACQAGNYLSLDTQKLGVDMMTINASKVYGPKGVGALFVREGVLLAPEIRGGGQERGIRAGTENVAGIVGFARALEIAQSIREEESARLTEIRDHFAALIRERLPEAVINGTMDDRLPNNMNVTITSADHEFLAIALDERGIACSTKSACDERDAETSHVLEALRSAQTEQGLPDGALAKAGLRFSMGRDTKVEDIECVIDTLCGIVDKLVVRV